MTHQRLKYIFKSYHGKLCSQPPSANIEQTTHSRHIRSSNNRKNLLAKPITRLEIEKAIHKLSPGCDDLPSEWYKTLKEQLIPLLEFAFIYTLVYGELPVSWKEAVMTVLLKKKNSET